jgi:uncharacterized membrane protein
MTRARDIVTKCLLCSSLFLLAILVTSTIGIAIDTKHYGSFIISSCTVSLSFAAIVGIIVSGAGLALAIMERNTAV